MWSKQADTRNNTNKNMPSFKNKITNKKRKNVAISATDGVDGTTTDPVPKSNDDKNRQTKSSKNRNRNRNKKDASKNGNDDVTTTVLIDKDLETADVVLRNPSSRNNNAIKRYSDSFVIENNGQVVTQNKIEEVDVPPPVLTRAVSGFFIIDQARKARRISDLFRHSSTIKLSNSTENLKMNNEKNSVHLEKNAKKVEKQGKTSDNAKIDSRTKQNKKNDNVTSKVQSPKATPKESVPHTETSYLKRVRSKIYKSKSDATSAPKDETDAAVKSKKLKPKKSSTINGSRIPEDEVAVVTPNGLRKSLTHFDFRLTRQTSNLERIRPKAVERQTSLDSGEKPVLAKAKSSSAINLNLLRTRRNKIMEQVAARLGVKDVQNEFEFIAFGSVNNVSGLGKGDPFGSQRSLQKQPSWLHIHKEETEDKIGKGESKQCQPVSRSGSDRRPDAVREEGGILKHHHHQDGALAPGGASAASTPQDDGAASADKKADNGASADSSTILPATGSSRKVTSNINRSESVKEQSEKRKQRRNMSDPSHSTSGNVDLDQHAALSNTDSGSSSNSSISCNGRLSESPSNSIDITGKSVASGGNVDSDSDMEVEAEPWQNLVPPEELKNLPAHEKKRQDVINEFFHTESSHVRNLKVLYMIFYKKIQESQILKPDELSLVFPNMKEMLDIHTEINKEMRKRRKEDPIVKELGGMLLEIFDEGRGEQLRRAAATFCERQQLALEFIKRRRERDSKFDAVLAECEKKRQCRRLQLQGILPTEMQRLSKYPLLLERLIDSLESNKDDESSRQEELARLKRTHTMSKEILNHVNEAAKVAHNRHRLEEIQKHLDTSSFERSDQPITQEFKLIDLTKFKLIIEGGMQLRRPNKPIVPVHILLLEQAVFILHREGDKFLLKFFQSGSPAQPLPLSPIIKMNTLLIRHNAVCKNALFLVSTSTSNSQMYDLIAEDEIKREVWFKHFSDASEAYNKREGKPTGGAKRFDQQPTADDNADDEEDDDEDSASEVAIELPAPAVPERRAAEVGGESETGAVVVKAGENEERDGAAAVATSVENDRMSTRSPEMVAGGGIQTSRVSAEEWPLIQPSEVSVAVPPVHTAESMLTPLEQIRRKDALVKQALEDKEGLVADMLSIPREDFQHIADMASIDTSASREPSERVLASIFQVDQLQKAVNQCLNVNESDALVLKGGKHPSCTSQQIVDGSPAPTLLAVSATLVRDIATSLSSQLTTLLSEVKHIEEERDRLRKELHRVRERLHEEHNLHSPVPIDDSENQTSSTSCASEQITSNDSIQVINKSDYEEQ